MGNKSKKAKILEVRQKEKFQKARENFEKLQKEIAPFTKRRTFLKTSTDQEWCKTSYLYNHNRSAHK